MNLIRLEEVEMYTERRATVDNQMEREEIVGVARPDALDPQELWVKGAGSHLSKKVLSSPGEDLAQVGT